jgi:phosphoribosylamine---glycine ligase
MNVLLIGSGGREHALAWKIKQSPWCDQLWVAPGNPGIAEVAEVLSIPALDFISLGKACLEKEISLVVVGPEAPLVEGLRDYFESDPLLRQVAMVGPGKAGAQLEGSKDFSKQFMLRHGIPTAKAITITPDTLPAGLTYLKQCSFPIVLKADGLAAGKGVLICQTLREAEAELRAMVEDQKFGAASSKVLIEEFLSGIELSVFVLTDGEGYVILPEAKDYKRIGDHDTGLNTGGMGAVSPVPFATPAFLKKVEDRIIKPTLEGLRKEHISYQGFIFIGIMSVKDEPYVIEYNARMGDPETQSVMSRIESDFLELLIACGNKSLAGKVIKIKNDYAVTVVLASGGYPGEFSKGHPIELTSGEARVFHAGTRLKGTQLITDGGRVLGVTGMGHTLTEAQKQAYATVSKIRWEGVTFRLDIGNDLHSGPITK